MLQIPLNLRPGAGRPLYRQLYEGLAAQIRTGRLKAGTRLPGKRALAAELSLSVNTVDTAYQMLAAEGYLESRPRSGFFVLEYTDVLPAAAPAGGADTGLSHAGADSAQPAGRPPKAADAPAVRFDLSAGGADTGLSPAGADSALPANRPPKAADAPAVRFDLSTGGADTGLFPFRTWGRIQKDLLYSAPELLAHGDAQGDPELRQALAAYLAAYRGVRCTPGQIVVGAGAEYLLGLLAPLLAGPCAVEDPGYASARTILQNSGLACRFVPVDEGGLSVAALAAGDAALCYVTPSHQFPSGVTMPAGRRAELLRWAAGGRRYIIEDDYDSEFRYDVRPLPSLQGMAGPAGPVVYLSTVSQSLAPSIRIAYLVLPQPLLAAWRARYGGYSNTVSRFEQQTFCRFLTEGYFTRHLARMRLECRRRRDAFAGALTQAFAPQPIRLAGLHAGLHLLLTLPGGPGEAAMTRAARDAGIRLAGLSEYYRAGADHCPPDTVVLGYGALLPALAPAAAEALKNAFSAAASSSSGT